MIFVILVLLILGGVFALGRFSSRRVSTAKYYGTGYGKGMTGKQNFRHSDRSMMGKNLARSGSRISGNITTIDGNKITINYNNASTIVNIADTTSIRNSSGIAKLSDLKVGNTISVIGSSNSNGSVQAKKIIIQQ